MSCIFSINPVERLEVVSPHLQCLMYWMANCIELRGYLSMNQASLSVAVGSSDVMDEIMNVLSDSVIYAFQQTVYHLTKVGILVNSIEHVQKYPTMHYFGIPRHSESMIEYAYMYDFD